LFDKLLVTEILQQIIIAGERVSGRSKEINTAEDFLVDERGLEKLDSICMQLIAIGESLKNLDKITHHELLSKYSAIEWQKAMGLRDIISHHYFDINSEIIYDVCKHEIPALIMEVNHILKDIEKQI